ncbi:MAG: glutaredoxin family protein [Nanoarchaeota archaeon]|nr:glutaredoxin family protein [Nanoarchaeota archaeon]
MTVKIYTTSTCPWCIKTKEFFKENKVKYKNIDVGLNKKAAKEMIEKSGQTGVPVIEINKQLIVGFDESKLKKALKLK